MPETLSNPYPHDEEPIDTQEDIPTVQALTATPVAEPQFDLAAQPPLTFPPETETREEKELPPNRVELARQAIDSLMVPTRPTEQGEDVEIYLEAAWPGYQSSFSRDTEKTLELAGEADKLESQLRFEARRQGKKADPVTWEEPGKIHHELPSVEMHGKSSAYNACDTTAEFLRGIAILAEHGDNTLLNELTPNIMAGVEYIQRHVNQLGLFVEDPSFSGVDIAEDDRQGALKVTYWKDSELNREGGVVPGGTLPKYPIIYTLAHFQNAEAVIRMGRARHDQQMEEAGVNMMQAGIKYLWRGDHFVTALDRAGIIDEPSTDSLHALLHIPPEFLPDGYAQKIEAYSEQLETEAGYRAGIPVEPSIDPYHTMTVWTHEQALLHAAAGKHGLAKAQGVASRIIPFIRPEMGLYPELIDVNTLHPGGNARQAWAMGACIYFEQPDKALL